ncbi:hypothetical protein [Streptomyces sp. XD-27]|uniref:SCO4983 family protein n=1 Tax=Streptomyces sp. XD-27 TaxID=3062779 RepID=UPI0026F43076|nr:hypothetical protein [Streptomyces sp. XD-27]WKX72280.1 hypothetical protein Q3Y56_22390 [Streptomyces sp. XD-27]
MYEPIRTKSVHSMAAHDRDEHDIPHRSRREELEIRLAGHLTALLTITDELRALAPEAAGLDDAAQRLADQVTRLRDGRAPLRAAPTVTGDPSRIAARVGQLHQRAHALAGNALVVATSCDDAAGAALAAERMAAHAAALGIEA